MNKILLSKFQKAKKNRDFAVWVKYNRLMNLPGSMQQKVYEILMEEFSISSPTTIWNIRKKFLNKKDHHND